MKGSDFLQKLLSTYEVERIFGVLGREAASILFDKAHSQEFLLFRNELSAGTAAAAASRLTEKPQVCFSTLGPGVTHMMTAMATAAQDRHPVLFISAQLETHAIDYNNAHQCLDAVSMTQSITKGSYEPRSIEELAVAVDRAFSNMMKYPFGPTFISLPINLLDDEVEQDHIDKWLLGEKQLTPKFDTDDSKTFNDSLRRLVAAMETAKNPIIILGDTAAKIPEVDKVLPQLLEQLNIPVIATYAAKGILPFDHPLCLGSTNSYLNVIFEEEVQQAIFEKADTILLLGYDMIEHSPNAWKYGESKKIISINYFDNKTNKSFLPDIKIIGDLLACIEHLAKTYKARPTTSNSIREARETIANRMKHYMQEKSDVGVTVPQAIQALNDTYGEYDYIVANDIGMHRHVVGTYFMPKHPHFYLTSAGLSSFGTGIGMAIGAALSRPNERVVLIAGDGGFHSNSGDLETIVRKQLPITIILLNNSANGLIKRYQLTGDERKQDTSVTEFLDVDFVKLAAANNMSSYRAENSEKLHKVLASHKNDIGPFLVEVPVQYPDLYINPHAKHWDGNKPQII